MAVATIRDVARRADVSVASVSRALNGHESVAATTRARVVAAAEALGYVPHAGARSLSMARSNTIGVVLPDLHGEFFSEIVRGMDGEAGGRGLQLLLATMHADPAQAAHAIRMMRGRVDGLVVMAPQLAARAILDALPPGVPAVLVNAPAEAGAGRPGLGIDNRAGAEAVARHLLSLGRRRLVHVRGPERNLDADARAEAFAATVAREAPDATLTVLPGDFSERGGEAAAQAVLSGRVAADAVFAANDISAIGCMTALAAGGRSIPGDIAVAGFDDVPVARHLDLTTMRVRIAEMGARAIARLNRQVAEPNTAATTELLVPDLVVRGSTVRQGHKKWGTSS